MLEKVLVPLGGFEDADRLSAFVNTLSPDRRIIVHGLGIVDIPGVESSLSGAPIGAISMAEEAREKVSSSEKKRVREFVRAFGEKLDEKKVEYEHSIAEGSPIEEIASRTFGHDLVVINSSSIFSFQKEKESPSFFVDLILEIHQPVLFFVPNGFPPDAVGVASDFGREFHHSLFAFLHLGLYRKSRILFAHVSSEGERTKRFTPYREYFRLHGYTSVTEVPLKGEKISAVRRFVETEEVGLLILGKRGESRFREYLFGSLTESLVKDTVCSLFIYE
ncbi:MAG: universal stress protein [Deltaproteobacteria bacterium]|nr:MAG: universal stress protein [Deltaproteobacteria bacterium]